MAHLVVDGDEVLSIEDGNEGKGGNESKKGHDGVRVLGAEGLGPWLAHHTLGHHVLEGSGLQT